MNLLPVSATDPEAGIIDRAADSLRAGRLVAFPTETVYGLGANALDAEAVGRIFAAKGRPATNPLIVHVDSIVAARQLAAEWPTLAQPLVERFWPGPLTLVVPKAEQVPAAVTAGGPTVALRMPAHPVALALLRVAKVPVAAPSANRSSLLSPTHAEHVGRDLEEHVDLILDAGPCPGGIESTVLDVTVSPPRLLRPGLLTAEAIENAVGPIDRARFTPQPHRPAPSPGLQGRHYAPVTPLETVEGDSQERVFQLLESGQRVGWLSLRPTTLSGEGLRLVAMPADSANYSGQLYAVLHALDDAGLDRIVVELPPDSPEWLAIRDRLHRASRSE
ncbi:MAG: L-threonylcarbamoyladenylate synthase [Gemmataceae bacterium]